MPIPVDSTIMIAGGAGFIGSHLCDYFVGQGVHVICVDNLLSGSRKNIEHLLDNPHFRFIEKDICSPLDELYKLEKLSAILHFASPASPNPSSSVSYMAHPVETLMVNSLGTKNLLDLSRANNCQIILASTSEVYGDPLVHPQVESYNGNVSPNGPRSCYDESKRFMEAIAFAYYRTYQTKAKVIRIFNTYGPRMMLDEGRFIPSLVKSIVTGEPFHLLGDGNVTRSFCYIDDLVNGIIKVSASDQAIGEVINLGNPEEYLVKEAIAILEEVTGKQITIIKEAALQDDPKRRKPDITKAKKLLGWGPVISLRDGLQKMIAHYE